MLWRIFMDHATIRRCSRSKEATKYPTMMWWGTRLSLAPNWTLGSSTLSWLCHWIVSVLIALGGVQGHDHYDCFSRRAAALASESVAPFMRLPHNRIPLNAGVLVFLPGAAEVLKSHTLVNTEIRSHGSPKGISVLKWVLLARCCHLSLNIYPCHLSLSINWSIILIWVRVTDQERSDLETLKEKNNDGKIRVVSC